jgi:hypothetical protein
VWIAIMLTLPAVVSAVIFGVSVVEARSAPVSAVEVQSAPGH